MLKFSRGNPTLIALFVGGIVLPSLVLTVMSIRSIRGEIALAEKSYEDAILSFQKEASEAIRKEMDATLQECKRRSLFLFDQPKTFTELAKGKPSDEIKGVQALFLFDNRELVYPSLLGETQTNASFAEALPNAPERMLYELETESDAGPAISALRTWREAKVLSPEERVINQVGLLRALLKQGEYFEAFRLLEILERKQDQPSYLHARLGDILPLVRFNLLVRTKQYPLATRHALDYLRSWLNHNDGVIDLQASRFLFESMFSSILSFEDLDDSMREDIWNIRKNLNAQIDHALLLSQFRGIVEQLHGLGDPTSEGTLYLKSDANWFFRMSHPWLPGDQIAIGILDHSQLEARLMNKINSIAREWKQVQYSVHDDSDSLLGGRLPLDTLAIASRITLADGYPRWTMVLYQRDLGEVRAETRQKMVFLYSLVGLSILVIIMGTALIMKSISQEQRLLSMKANFLSSVSHELKTPLTSIKMFSEMMSQGRVQKAEKVMEYSGHIGKEATRLENLIQAILNYTRMEHGTKAFQWERLDLSACAEKVAQSLSTIAASRGLVVQSHLQPGCWIVGDYTSLYSLVQNLLDNAIKYTPSGGQIDLQTTEEPGGVILSVADTGIGIPLQEQKNIFNDFYRVGDEMTRTTKGSGLGLAIVKRAAEAHKASITLNSRPGKGSTFTVRFRKAENE